MMLSNFNSSGMQLFNFSQISIYLSTNPSQVGKPEFTEIPDPAKILNCPAASSLDILTNPSSEFRIILPPPYLSPHTAVYAIIQPAFHFV